MSEVFVSTREWVSELCVIITKAAAKADKFSYYSVISGINDWPGDPPQHKEILLKRIEDAANGDEPCIIIDILIAAGSHEVSTPERTIAFHTHGHDGWREVLDTCIQRKFNRPEHPVSCKKETASQLVNPYLKAEKHIRYAIYGIYVFVGLKIIDVIATFFK